MEDLVKKEYELAVLLDNEASEGELDSFLNSFSAKDEMANLQKKFARPINLAYPIKKHLSAVFAVYEFFALPELIIRIKDQMRLKNNILRHLIINAPIKSEKQNRAIRTRQDQPVEIKPPVGEIASNEVLEKTLEEILK